MADPDLWRLSDFKRSQTSLSERTLSAYGSDLRLFSEWVARSSVDSPAGVTRTLVRRYIASLSTREFARRSIARKAAALRRYYAWAIESGLAEIDPTIGVQVSAGQGRLPRILDRRELDQLLDGPTGDDEPVWRRHRDDAVLDRMPDVYFGSAVFEPVRDLIDEARGRSDGCSARAHLGR